MNRYVPVIKYKDSIKDVLQHIVLDKQSFGLFRPFTEGGLSDVRVIWRVIKKNKEIRPLFDIVAEILLPIGFIITGLAVLLGMLKVIV